MDLHCCPLNSGCPLNTGWTVFWIQYGTEIFYADEVRNISVESSFENMGVNTVKANKSK